MDDKTALDLLSGDFYAAPTPTAPVTSAAGAAKLEPPVLDSDPLKVTLKINSKAKAHTSYPMTRRIKRFLFFLSCFHSFPANAWSCPRVPVRHIAPRRRQN